MTINWSRPVQTRDGREVFIYSRGNGGTYPIHGKIKAEYGWSCHTWTEDGRACLGISGPIDLVNAPIRVNVNRWANVYDDHRIVMHSSRAEADADIYPGHRRIACIHICREVLEGEGL